jgi:hypothetical protein
MNRTARHQHLDDRQPPAFSEQYLLARLIAAGVGSLDEWRALSPRAKRNIFGITVDMARALDSLARRESALTRPS